MLVAAKKFTEKDRLHVVSLVNCMKFNKIAKIFDFLPRKKQEVAFNWNYNILAVKITKTIPSKKTSLLKSQKLVPQNTKKLLIHKIKLPQKFYTTQ